MKLIPLVFFALALQRADVSAVEQIVTLGDSLSFAYDAEFCFTKTITEVGTIGDNMPTTRNWIEILSSPVNRRDRFELGWLCVRVKANLTSFNPMLLREGFPRGGIVLRPVAVDVLKGLIAVLAKWPGHRPLRGRLIVGGHPMADEIVDPLFSSFGGGRFTQPLDPAAGLAVSCWEIHSFDELIEFPRRELHLGNPAGGGLETFPFHMPRESADRNFGDLPAGFLILDGGKVFAQSSKSRRLLFQCFCGIDNRPDRLIGAAESQLGDEAEGELAVLLRHGGDDFALGLGRVLLGILPQPIERGREVFFGEAGERR